MVIETPVFGDEDGVDQVRRDLFEGDGDAMLFEQRGDEIVVGVVEQRRFRSDVEAEPVGKRFQFDAQRPQPLHREACCD